MLPQGAHAYIKKEGFGPGGTWGTEKPRRQAPPSLKRTSKNVKRKNLAAYSWKKKVVEIVLIFESLFTEREGRGSPQTRNLAP